MESEDEEERRESEHAGLSEEATYICNSCGEEIIVPLDYSQGRNQEYVEDCPVCCNPNIIFVEFHADGRASIRSHCE